MREDEMPKKLSVRAVTTEEKEQIERFARSRTEPARLVQRAKVIQAMVEDTQLPANRAGCLAGYESGAAGRRIVKRFNAEGLAGLEDAPRAGRPRTHAESVRSALVSLATQKPESLGYPFKLWTLERLQTAFEERENLHLSDSTIWEWLAEEGLEWKRQESWFHEAEKHDPQFVEKRGP
jgi:transposase